MAGSPNCETMASICDRLWATAASRREIVGNLDVVPLLGVAHRVLA